MEQAIQDIIERGDEAQAEMARAGERVAEKERETPESIRKRSMEILAERECQEGGRKRRKADGDKEVIDYMRDRQLKREEFELRRREIEVKEKEIKIKEKDIETKEKEKEREWEEARARNEGKK